MTEWLARLTPNHKIMGPVQASWFVKNHPVCPMVDNNHVASVHSAVDDYLRLVRDSSCT